MASAGRGGVASASTARVCHSQPNFTSSDARPSTNGLSNASEHSETTERVCRKANGGPYSVHTARVCVMCRRRYKAHM